MLLNELVTEFALDSKNPQKIFDMAREYDRLEQGAMAIGLYLRAADIEEEDVDFQYKCMVYMAEAYRRQRDRKHSVLMSLQHALRLRPNRPEALYLMMKHYESWGDWRNYFLYAEYGLRALELDDLEDPIKDVGYPGKFAFYYGKALADWKWLGSKSSRDALFNFRHRMKKGPHYKRLSDQLVQEVGYPHSITYTQHPDFERYKFTFDGLASIDRNYSAHFQDMFVLSLLNGKRGGTYVELGSCDPFVNNNTALLETKFDWKGVSIDKEEKFAYDFSCKRNNTVICADAMHVNYEDLFHQLCMDHEVDLLQIDCGRFSIGVLKNIPFDQYKFNIVQFAHNHTESGQSSSRDEQRAFMTEKGYKLVVNDVASSPTTSFEDWWVHSSFADNVPENMWSQKETNFVWDYMMDSQYLQDASEFVE